MFSHLIIRPCPWQKVKWLSPLQARPIDNRPLIAGSEYEIDRNLASFAEEIVEIIKHSTVELHPPSGPRKIFLSKLPSTSPVIFGREKELEELDAAWKDPQTNIVSLLAWGGMGKSALVNKWLHRMKEDDYRGAEEVYGWSFHTKRDKDDKIVSADLFITSALRWFGDPDPERGGPWDKGIRLAELIRYRKILLILDGIEYLQNPPGMDGGYINDLSLQCFIRELANYNKGLCVISTRLAVEDIKGFITTSVKRIVLEHLFYNFTESINCLLKGWFISL